MTQPAKANEPSMEEILASIRRIIADDDATKSEHSGLEPQKPAVSASPAVAAASVKAPPQQSPIDAAAAAGTVNDIRADEESAEILELTESMAAPMPIRPVAMPAPRSIPPSTPWRRPCWCKTPARSRTWCAKCCGRCSRLGSTRICPAWSSVWCAPKSSGSRAGVRPRAASVAVERRGKPERLIGEHGGLFLEACRRLERHAFPARKHVDMQVEHDLSAGRLVELLYRQTVGGENLDRRAR